MSVRWCWCECVRVVVSVRVYGVSGGGACVLCVWWLIWVVVSVKKRVCTDVCVSVRWVYHNYGDKCLC